MALVVVSKMQELIPASGKVSRDDSREPENSVIPGLLLPGKETEGGRWSSKRQLTKAFPQRLSGFAKRIKMFYKESSKFIEDLEIYVCQGLFVLTRQSC